MSAYRHGRSAVRTDGDYAGPERAVSPSGYEPSAARSGRRGSLAAAAALLIPGDLASFLTGLAIVLKTSYRTSQAGYGTAAASYAYHRNITAWRWSSLVLGVIIVVTGVLVLLREARARWLSVVLAVISAGGTFMFLPFYPYWSLVVIALDVFVVWALAAGATAPRSVITGRSAPWPAWPPWPC